MLKNYSIDLCNHVLNIILKKRLINMSVIVMMVKNN